MFRIVLAISGKIRLDAATRSFDDWFNRILSIISLQPPADKKIFSSEAAKHTKNVLSTKHPVGIILILPASRGSPLANRL